MVDTYSKNIKRLTRGCRCHYQLYADGEKEEFSLIFKMWFSFYDENKYKQMRQMDIEVFVLLFFQIKYILTEIYTVMK